MLLLLLRSLFIQFFFYCHSRASGEADNGAEVFCFDFGFYAPPFFFGVLVLIQQGSYGGQSGYGGNQGNKLRITAAPYQLSADTSVKLLSRPAMSGAPAIR